MFKVEIFDMYSSSFQDAFMVGSEVEFSFDYMAPKPITVRGPADLTAAPRNTVRVNRDDDNLFVYAGYIQTLERTPTATILTIAPLMMLLNEKSMQNTKGVDWGHQLWWQIYYDFQQTNRSLYPVPWILDTRYPYQNWDGVKQTYGAELLSDMECIIEAARTYGKFMRFAFGTGGSSLGRPYFGYYKYTNTKTIEADLDNIISKEINETTKGGYNIRILWFPISEGSTAYNHYDAVLINGQIIQDYTLKPTIADPRMVEKVVSTPNPTATEVNQFFRQSLKPASDNFEISITIRRDDKIIGTVGIGQPCSIISGGKTYNTYCTGYTYRVDTVTYKFGTVRQELTALLNSEE